MLFTLGLGASKPGTPRRFDRFLSTGCMQDVRENTTLKWNSKELKFDVAEANALVRRDYREGW